MTFHVLIPDNVDKKALELLEQAGFHITAGNMSREETIAALPSADALIIRSATTVDAGLLQHASKLKAIARAGVGVDNVDLAIATEKGIVVMNTPFGNTISTAEHAFGLMLALARNIPISDGTMRQGRWDRKQFMGVELRGKTLGLIGFGRIGQALAVRAIAFEMNVVAFDPYVAPEIFANQGVQGVDLDTLYTQADFISLHTVVTDETRNMISAESLSRMKHGVRLINAARGALVDEQALADAIKSGQVAGAALDVYSSEPPPPENPLIGLENVVHTPHLAASTSDAQVQVAVDAATQIINALLKQEFENVVNRDVLTQ